METKLEQFKFELLDYALRLRPAPVAVFSVFDDEHFHREAILVYEDDEKKAA